MTLGVSIAKISQNDGGVSVENFPADNAQCSPTAPSVASAPGTARILMANWILRKMIVARCQLTVRNLTCSPSSWKISRASRTDSLVSGRDTLGESGEEILSLLISETLFSL